MSDVSQQLAELATTWRSAGNMQRAITKAVHDAYQLGCATSRKEALDEAVREADGAGDGGCTRDAILALKEGK